MRKSFFGKYCLYKLKGFRGLAIAAAVPNFAALVLQAVFFYIAFDDANRSGYSYIYFEEMPFVSFCVIAIAAMAVILVITPAISFKYYNSRAAMDTLGCLPLNYSERFCGDFLSGLTANLISFIPFTAIGAVIVAVMQNTSIKEMQARLWAEYNEEYIFSGIKDDFLKVYLGFVLLLLLGYIGTYVISTFVTSCCGRAGSSIFYSVIALIVPAGIVSTFGTCVLNGAVGVIVEEEIENVLMVIAPAGLWIGTGMRFMLGDDLTAMTYIVDNPVYIVIALLITAAFLVGAYFLGKHRKAERVDRDFVYNGAYHVIALALSATIIGFYFSVSPANAEAFTSGNVQQIIISIAVGLVIYVVMELVHTRNAKKLPISLLRYAPLYAVCFLFLFIAHKTDSFGIAKRLPNKDSVSSVKVEGDFFYSPTGEAFIYRSESAIDKILSEHEKLIQNRGSLETGSTVTVSYTMKNGSELRRQYYPRSGSAGREFIKAFSDEVKKNEISEGGLGFLDDMRYDELKLIECRMNNPQDYFYVDPEASAEIFEALRYDLLNNFEQYQYSVAGHIIIFYKLNGMDREASYMLNDAFERTLAAVEKNRVDDTPDIGEEEFYYHIYYSADLGEEAPVISSIVLDLQNTDESELAKAVMEYISERKDVPEEERSERLYITSGSQYKEFCVRKADERAMLKAVLKISAEMSRSE